MKYLLKFKTFRHCLSGLRLNFDKEDYEHLIHIHIYIEYKESTRLYINKVFVANILTKKNNKINVNDYYKGDKLNVFLNVKGCSYKNNYELTSFLRKTIANPPPPKPFGFCPHHGPP